MKQHFVYTTHCLYGCLEIYLVKYMYAIVPAFWPFQFHSFLLLAWIGIWFDVVAIVVLMLFNIMHMCAAAAAAAVHIRRCINGAAVARFCLSTRVFIYLFFIYLVFFFLVFSSFV